MQIGAEKNEELKVIQWLIYGKDELQRQKIQYINETKYITGKMQYSKLETKSRKIET